MQPDSVDPIEDRTARMLLPNLRNISQHSKMLLLEKEKAEATIAADSASLNEKRSRPSLRTCVHDVSRTICPQHSAIFAFFTSALPVKHDPADTCLAGANANLSWNIR